MKDPEVIIKIMHLGQSGWFLQEKWTEDDKIGREMDNFKTFENAYEEASRWEADLSRYGIKVLLEQQIYGTLPKGRESQVRASFAKKNGLKNPKKKKAKARKKIMTEEEVEAMMEQSLKDGTRWRGRLW